MELFEAEYQQHNEGKHYTYWDQSNTVQCSLINKKGPWSQSETEYLLAAINEFCQNTFS